MVLECAALHAYGRAVIHLCLYPLRLETFYYFLEWFEKPQWAQRDTEKKSNAPLCSLCPLWLIFFAMIHFIQNLLKSLTFSNIALLT